MIYRFGDCVLDSQRRELIVGGAPVHVEPQVFDVLRYGVPNGGGGLPLSCALRLARARSAYRDGAVFDRNGERTFGGKPEPVCTVPNGRNGSGGNARLPDARWRLYAPPSPPWP
jgi:hypothetical protein